MQERLFREFDMDVVTTVPNVSYKVFTTQGQVMDVHNPSGLPAPTLIDHIEEPYISVSEKEKIRVESPLPLFCWSLDLYILSPVEL